jgi:hypothetical protein
MLKAEAEFKAIRAMAKGGSGHGYHRRMIAKRAEIIMHNSKPD